MRYESRLGIRETQKQEKIFFNICYVKDYWNVSFALFSNLEGKRTY